MKRVLPLVVVLFAVVAIGTFLRSGARGAPMNRAASAPHAPLSARARRVRTLYLGRLDSLDAALATLERSASGDAKSARLAFGRARRAYKAVEPLAEYYSPHTARDINGPAIDRAEDDAPDVVIAATGFQVAEAALFPQPSHDWSDVVTRQGALLRRNTDRLRRIATETEPTDSHVFDAARLSLARVATLGLTGFDASLSGDGVSEGAATVRGVRDLLLPYRDDLRARDGALWDSLDARIERTAARLDSTSSAGTSPYLALVVGSLTPAARALDSCRRALGIDLPAGKRAWSAEAATSFERGAFDARAFAPAYAPVPTPALLALGRDLFFDPALSGDGRRACASCHQPDRAFTDGLPRRSAVEGASAHGAAGRNTPSVINVGLQPVSFYDQRTTFLEDQVTDVIGNHAEMGHAAPDRALEDISSRLRSRSYPTRFVAAFGGRADSAVTPLRLRLALAAYLRSLQALDSRFDRAMRGDTLALTADERHGLGVFVGKGKCATCHFVPLLNGATPPTYIEAEPEVIGVPDRATTTGGTLDTDVGRFAIDRIGLHRHAFKTPTLRNVALTAPYMHNGAYRTLEQVVDFYDRGGGHGIGVAIDNQTLPTSRLRLTPVERRDLVSFLRALTDTVGLTARPGR